MGLSFPLSGLQLHSLISKSGELEVLLAKVDVPPPGPNGTIRRIGLLGYA